MIERRYEAERAATLRAGLIASTLINVNRKKGAKLVTPQDFIKEPRKEEDYMSPREAAAFMDKWAAGVNRGAKKKSKKRGAEG